MIGIKVKYAGAVPGVAKRELNKIAKIAYEQVGILWHSQFRRKHFTRAGAREYRYAPRKGEAGNPGRKGFFASYTGRKLREHGHTRPLVYSGMSEMMTRARVIRATSKGVRIVLQAGNIGRRNTRSKINLRKEVTEVSASEAKQLVRLFNRVMDRKLRALRDTKTKRLA